MGLRNPASELLLLCLIHGSERLLKQIECYTPVAKMLLLGVA